MTTNFNKFILIGLLLSTVQAAWAQVRLQVRVNSGSSGTSCTDNFFGGAPDPQWRVNIANQGWTTYPRTGICFSNVPNTQYDETFRCPSDYPGQIQVCFRAFEDDGTACVVGEDCTETLCQNFPAPAPGTSATYTMTIPNNGTNRSWGTVNFTLTASGSFSLPGAANDRICDAINMGILPSGGSLGNRNLSNYGNYCAGNAGDPNPPNWNNEQGVWFRFTTSSTPGAVIRIEATNDPAGRGDQIDLQLALYRSSNGSCTGTLTRIQSEHTIPLYSEEMAIECLLPNTTYYLLVDGADNGIFGGQEGFFGLQIYDDGIRQAADLICDAENLGTVPAGGSIGTPPLSRSNVCATNTNDPTPGTWAPDQSVWFSFVAPPTGHVIIEATSDLPAPFGTDAVDIQLAVYSTTNNLCTGTPQYIDGSYNPLGFDEELDVRCLNPGQRYWILLDGSGLNVDGIFGIRVRDGGIPPAPNDDICNAIALGAPLPGGIVSRNNQNNYCADNIFEPIPSNWGNDQGVWYTFVAPPSGKVEVRAQSLGNALSGDPIDLQLAVYDSDNMTCTGNLREVRSEYEGIGLLWDEDMEVECLIPGRTYYILVDGQGSLINPGLQEGQFNIQVYGDPRDPAAPNDAICNFLPLGNPTGGSVGTTRGPQHGSQNNFCATAAGEPQPSGFTADQTVWYQFIAPATGNVRIRLQSDPVLSGVDPINLQVAVWSSSNNNCSGGTWREIMSGDDLIYDVDMEVYCLEPGRPYFVQVDGAPPTLLGGHEGYFDIRISELPPIPVAPNNLICNATPLGNPFATGSVGLTNQHNLCADDIGDPQPSAFGTDQTVWYTFTTPPTGGPYAVDVIGTSSLPWPFGNRDAIDLQIAVWESSNNTCTGTLTEIDSEYDPIIFNESVRVQCLQPGRTYFIMVDGSFIDDQGYFDIEVRPAPGVPIPTNDLICNHIDLGTVPVGGNINNGTNYFNFCADTEPGEPSPFGIDQTVWFSFVAPNHVGPNATSNVRVRVESDPGNVGNNIDVQLAVYESSNNACNGSMRLLESDDPLFSRNAQVDLTCLYPGRRYWVQVDGSAFDVDGYFRVVVEDRGSGIRPPYNDICQAVNLGVVPNGGSINNGVNYLNLCSDVQAGEPTPDAFGIEQTVWFQFQAPASGNVTITARNDPNNVGDQIDLQLAVYQAANNNCTGPYIEIDSRYNPFGFDEELRLECLVPGGIYYIQVDGAGGGLLGGEEGYFTIRVRDDGGTSNFPYNNDICNAHNFGVPTGGNQTLGNETNECANVQFGEPGVGNYATNTVWYQFTAPPSARVRIEVESNNIFTGVDPEVYVFASSNNACNGTFTRVESSNLPTALITERIDATCLIPGNTYFIQVDGSGLVREGRFTIRIRDLEPAYATGAPNDPQPVNNYCANATPIPVQGQSCFNGNGSFQTYNYGIPTITHNPPFARNCNDNCGDTWYSFTMPASGIALIEGDDDAIGSFPGDFSDLTVVAYTGTCNNLSPIACGGGGLTRDVSFEVAATPGSTVYLQVFNDEGDDDRENYRLCVSEGCGADNCLNALAYPIQPNIPYCFNTASAQGENVAGGAPGYFECGEGDNPERSLYFYFVSDCNGSAVTINIINARSNGGCILGTVPDDGFNISFFQDATPCDNNPTALVDCQNFNSCMVQPINWSRTYTNLQPNTPYIIQIDGGFNFLGGNNQGEIMIQTTTNPIVNPISTPVSCGSSNDGTASAPVVGGLAPYSFQWSNGRTDSTITNLAAGVYFVTATSINGCFDTGHVVVNAPNLLLANLGAVRDASCAGNCDGQATVAGSGGTITTGYTYRWSAGNQTTATATGLCPGTHTVTVFDNGGCSVTQTVSVSNPSAVSVALVNSSPATCAGVCTGSATVQGSGGTVAFQHRYLWSNGTSLASATGLCGGVYTVTVTDDNSCSASLSITITEPASVTASIVNQDPVTCQGASDGSVQVAANNGTPPYQYSYNGAFSANSGFTGLAAGAYTITVQDANGCQAYLPVTITEPSAVTATLISTIDVSCAGANDGSITAAGSGGSPGYQYSLDGLNFSNSPTFANLSAGNYTITVRDANGCTATVPASIIQPTGITASVINLIPAACGACNGAAGLNLSGGSSPYTYAWANGQTSQNATGLCSGNQAVTITDLNGCSATVPFNLPNAGSLASTVTITQPVSCAGACDAELTVSPVGGSAPYTFAWADGQTTAQRTNLCAGNYIVTITDVNGCLVVENINVPQPSPLQTLVAATAPPSCGNTANGQATATPSGGTAPYQFLWDNAETGQTATALSAGTHSLTVTDARGCTTTGNVTITAPAALSVTVQNTSPSNCASTGCTGEASILVQGGNAPYQYLWANGQTTSNANALCPGFNFVTVTDANGCTASAPVQILANTSLNLSATVTASPSCAGDCTGAASLSASGGNTTLPYTFSWSNGRSTAQNTGLCAGVYFATVTDRDGCAATTALTITEPSPLQVNALVASNYNGADVSCFGAADGQAQANVSGGVAPYQYQWSAIGQTQALATGLSAGVYTLSITDANNCRSTAQVTLTQPSLISPTANVSANYNGAVLSCAGASDGQAQGSATGGTGAYTFVWSNGQSSSSTTGLSAGVHTLSISDANGCLATTTVSLAAPPALVLNAAPSSNYNGFNVSCFGAADGQAQASATGGTGAYQFRWSNGSTGASISGLSAGNYSLTATDANGCTTTANLSLNSPAALSLNLSANQNASCFGLANGQALGTGTGGTAPYQYNWSNGQTTAQASGLAAASYTLTLTDANGCSVQQSISISQPTALTVTIANIQNLSCFGASNGSATAQVSGGTPSYSYQWSNSLFTPTATGLGAGSHSITITDANGCTASQSLNISQPAALTASTSVTSNYNGQQIRCANSADGTARVQASGGTGSYRYFWMNGQTTQIATGLQASTYFVTVTDANNCSIVTSVTLSPPPVLQLATQTLSNYNGFNVSCAGGNDGRVQATASGGTGTLRFVWSDGQTTTTATGMNPGTYALTVTDVNGCIAVDTGSLTAPVAVQATSTVLQNVLCNGQSNGIASIQVTGGLSPYAYAWSTGATGQTANNLPAGTHRITVTDRNGCRTTTTVGIAQPSTLTLNTSVTAASCFGLADGTAVVAPNGGSPSYQYNWSNGQTSASLSGLSAGSYRVTVTDANGCAAQASVSISQPSQVLISLSSLSPVRCFGGNEASLRATASGGTVGYTFVWSNGQSGNTASALAAGVYTVTATDARGCTATRSTTITQPNAVAATANITSSYNGHPISCAGATDGRAIATASGGTAPYRYLWSNGATTASVTGLGQGGYSVSITDANGCAATASISLTAPSWIELQVVPQNPITCFGGNNGTAFADAWGGTLPYRYRWSNGQTTRTATGLMATLYSVTVTDANGCAVDGIVNMVQPNALLIQNVFTSPASCFGGNDGMVYFNVVGGTPGYRVAWSNGQTSIPATNLAAGNYTVTVTDANGCTVRDSMRISQPSQLFLSFSNVQGVRCQGQPNGQATALVSGGSPGYTFLWDNGSQDSIATTLPPGDRRLTVTDANGCQVSASVSIPNAPALEVSGTSFNISCHGAGDGRAWVEVTGGIAPYTYLWSSGQTDSLVTNLGQGLHWCTITDANGCTALQSFFIREPAPFFARFTTVQNLSCENENDGYIQVQANGGSGGYRFIWSTGDTIQNGTNQSWLDTLAAGNYTITVSDTTGCTLVLDTFLVAPGSLRISGTGSRTRCFNSPDGLIRVSARGGTPPYSYALLPNGNPQADTVFTGLLAGDYQVAVIDALGCQATTNIRVTRRDSVLLAVPDSFEIDLGQTVPLYVQMPVNSPNNPIVTWTPSTGLSCTDCYQPTAQPSETTVYTVRIVGDDNCPVQASILVKVNKNYDVFIPNVFTPNGDGINDLFMVYSAGGVAVIEEMLIFDRWGELVFNRKDALPNLSGYGWDGSFKGKPMNAGVFVYYARIRFLDGTVREFKGDLTLAK